MCVCVCVKLYIAICIGLCIRMLGLMGNAEIVKSCDFFFLFVRVDSLDFSVWD